MLCPMTLRGRKMKFPVFPEQLSLPIDCLLSERGAPSQSRGRSIGKRWPRAQDRLATSQSKPLLHGTVQASSVPLKREIIFGQPQRFSLTPTLYAIITEVNANRWRGNGSALPSLTRCPDYQSGEGRAYERRGSPRRLPQHPLGGH